MRQPSRSRHERRRVPRVPRLSPGPRGTGTTTVSHRDAACVMAAADSRDQVPARSEAYSPDLRAKPAGQGNGRRPRMDAADHGDGGRRLPSSMSRLVGSTGIELGLKGGIGAAVGGPASGARLHRRQRQRRRGCPLAASHQCCRPAAAGCGLLGVRPPGGAVELPARRWHQPASLHLQLRSPHHPRHRGGVRDGMGPGDTARGVQGRLESGRRRRLVDQILGPMAFAEPLTRRRNRAAPQRTRRVDPHGHCRARAPHCDQTAAESSPTTREPDTNGHKSRKLRAVVPEVKGSGQ